MGKFILRVLIFSIPFLVVIPIEMSIRKNSYLVKKDFVEQHKNEINIMLLGSSQNNKDINPEYIDATMVSLANDGATLNLDTKILDNYINKLPNLEIVIFEVSYHSFETLKGPNWSKNHLFLNYYGINNYEGSIPLSQRFLISSNPKEYLRKFITPKSKLNDNVYNEYGFVLNSESRFKKLNYDPDLIEQSSKDGYMKNRHQAENLEYYSITTSSLLRAIKLCQQKDIKVILLSPPKYYLYNSEMNKNILSRRDDFLSKVKSEPNVFIFNFERLFEMETTYFLNEDHLNQKGSEVFTKYLNEKIGNLSK